MPCKLTIRKKQSAIPEALGDCSSALVTLEADYTQQKLEESTIWWNKHTVLIFYIFFLMMMHCLALFLTVLVILALLFTIGLAEATWASYGYSSFLLWIGCFVGIGGF